MIKGVMPKVFYYLKNYVTLKEAVSPAYSYFEQLPKVSSFFYFNDTENAMSTGLISITTGTFSK